jgi:hypothetical protein
MKEQILTMVPEASQEFVASRTAESIDAFLDLLRRRCSIRSGFLRDEPVPDELIQTVLEAARWAGSLASPYRRPSRLARRFSSALWKTLLPLR